MMIASLWIIKDLSTDNDRTAHGQESKNASQHPDHCRLPIPAFSFLNATIVSMAARPVGRAMLVHECTFVIRDNIAFAMPFTACAGSRASEIMLHPSPGQDAEREGSEAVGNTPWALAFAAVQEFESDVVDGARSRQRGALG